MNLPLLKSADVKNKTVLLRLDLDVPLSATRIEDDSRLKAAMPTLEYLLKHNAKVVIAGHLGRPKGVDKSLSLEPMARWLLSRHPERSEGSHEILRKAQNDMVKTRLGGFDGWEITPQLFLLENLRFNEGEEKNDPDFTKQLADLADIYVNDAFAMCHRNHASVAGVPKLLPHFAGLHLEKEISSLTRAMDNPVRPLVVVIGGKKIETKLPMVEKMHRIADYVLVGGKIAQESKMLAKVQHEKIIGKKSVLLIADSTLDNLSIAQNSLNNFLEIIPMAKTIIWNGTMGYIAPDKEDEFQASRKIAHAIIDSKAYSIVGGGDTVEFLNRLKILDKFSFASTGGGAMLAFLSGEKLPGIEALSR